jgi:polyhydroxyalkanoate synthase
LDERCSGEQPPPVIGPLPHDKRFVHPSWQQLPYSLYYQAFLLTQQWWHNATSGIAGVSKHDQEIVAFVARQFLDMCSPSNFFATNPVVQKTTWDESGANLVRGWNNLWEDWRQAVASARPKPNPLYRPGNEVAVTPGKVVYRNHLIELIQYTAQTETVYPEPLLIVPACIMKYYILDLSPENSFVRYLVEHGHSVFCMSWRNPEAEDRDLCMDDYRRLGIMAALDAIQSIVPDQKVHTLGYCLGGTLLAIAMATMAREQDQRGASMTLLATQTDLSEAGELMLYIGSNELSYLDDMMWNQGYLETKQMAGAFTMLRSADLFWSRMLSEYLLGKRTGQSDLMAWNSDATRMPYRMHSEYLRQLFLENRLAQGKYRVDDHPIALSDIRVPLFVVGTSKDHVAPWKSVYKIHLLTDTEVTFLLTSGGHNAGVITPPGHPRRIYQVSTLASDAPYRDPDRWQIETPVHKGSWWPEYQSWLAEHSGSPVKPPSMGMPDAGYPVLADAPGEYVHQT